MILHIITSVEASSYDLETCIFLKDLLLKSRALHICYKLMHFPLFLTLMWLRLCMCMNQMNYKVGNLEFQREQLFGMKIGINLRMKVAVVFSYKIIFMFCMN